MDITRENINELNTVLKIKIQKNDYYTKVEDILRDYKKKLKMDGFRPGKVPFGLVKKLYYKPVLVEEVNKIISESLLKYISDEKLRILGDPLPSEKKSDPIDWDTQTDFEFSFDIGLAPEFEVNLSKRDKIPYYSIKTDKKMTESYVEGYTKRFGSYLETDQIETGEEVLTGDIKQVVDNTSDKQGIHTEKANFSLGVMKEEKIKNKFMGAKKGDSIFFDLKKAFPNDSEIAGILKIDKEKIPEVMGDFEFTVNEISVFVNAKLNQELYDKIFGKDKIKSEEEFFTEIEKEIQTNLDKESDMRFTLDTKEKLVRKLDLKLPDEFMNRWLIKTNEGKFTKEEIEKDFDHFKEDLMWQLIKEEVVKEQKLEINEEEILSYAKEVTLKQFMQYGLANVPDDQLEHYAKELLGKDDERKKLTDKLYEDKIVNYVKNTVKIEEKKISADEFNKLYEKK